MKQPVKVAITLFVLLMLAGTGGFMIIEGWSPLDSFYMTAITLSTVGFGEVEPLSPAERLFTSVLILLGVGTLAYSLARVIEALVEQRVLHWRRVRMDMKQIKNHLIVCGYGRMGTTTCVDLAERRVPLVVIERDPAIGERLDQEAILYLVGVTLANAPIRSKMDVIVVGVRRQDKGLIFNPPSDLAPQVGDVLLALGRLENLRQLEKLAVG